MTNALRAGVGVIDFWEMTPREVNATIEAYVWRAQQEYKSQTAQAWHTAMMTRAKRIPPLNQILSERKTKPMTEAEIAKRHNEFESMTKRMGFEVMQ